MKKNIIAYLFPLFAIFFLLSAFPVISYASVPDEEEILQEVEVEVNPLYADIIDEDDILQDSDYESGISLASAALTSSVIYYTDPDKVSGQIREGLKERDSSIVVYYKTADSDYKTIRRQLFYSAMEHTGEATEGDYLTFQYAGVSYSGSISGSASTAYKYKFIYKLTYYDTAAEEAEVDEKVTSILSGLNLDTLTNDYEKIKAIYQYLEHSITYDNAAIKSVGTSSFDDYYYAWSAYGAFIKNSCVCQGYSEALYRLLLEAGIDCRIISGYGGLSSVTNKTANHAWNIVKAGNKYYNMDVTWDSSYYHSYSNASYAERYFLKGDISSFTVSSTGSIHYRISLSSPLHDNTSELFYVNYPMDEDDYLEPCISIDGTDPHEWESDYTIDVEATCGRVGKKSIHCKKCSQIKDTKDIPVDSSNHAGGTQLRNASVSTCVTEGYTGDTCCLGCDTILSSGQSIDIDSSNHVGDTEIRNATDATCAKEGYTGDTYCKSCGGKIEDGSKVDINPDNHVGDTEIRDAKAATCTEEGYTGDTYCKSCGGKIEDGSKVDINPDNHVGDTEIRDAKAATCTEKGYTGDTYCKGCKAKISTGKEIAMSGHSWDAGTITLKATCISNGVKTFKCKNCTATKTETTAKDPSNHNNAATLVKNAKAATYKAAGYTGDTCCSACGDVLKKGTVIAKKDNVVLPSQASSDNPVSQDSSGLIGKDASALDSKVIATKSDEIKGTVFQLLQVRWKKIAANSLTIKWTKVAGATSYVIYGAKCGSKFAKLATTSVASYTQKKLTKGTYYKYFVVAIKGNTALATSKTIHLATSGGKVGNTKSVTLNKKSLSLKKGKKFTLKISMTPCSKKLTVKNHRAAAFESSNKTIATVSSKGLITAKKKGTCYIYAYAQDGVFAKVKVTVK